MTFCGRKGFKGLNVPLYEGVGGVKGNPLCPPLKGELCAVPLCASSIAVPLCASSIAVPLREGAGGVNLGAWASRPRKKVCRLRHRSPGVRTARPHKVRVKQ